jgi:hypothetical protein
LIPDNIIEKLAKLALSLDQCGHREFIATYVEKRSDALIEILSKQQDLVAEDINPDVQM